MRLLITLISIVVVASAVVLGVRGLVGPAHATDGAMAVDCDASTGTTDANCTNGSGATSPTATIASCAMSVSPVTAQSQVGVQSEFDVVITNCNDVAGASSKIGFDAHINVDSRLGSPAFPPLCNGIGTDTIDNSGHTVEFGCVRTPLTGVDGSGIFARYLYTCQSVGSMSLTFASSALTNHLAGPIAHALTGGSITCTAATTPPHTTSTPPSAATPTATSPSTPTTPTNTVTPTATSPSTSTPPRTVTATPTNTPVPTTPAPTRACGDVNDNGSVDAVDAQLVLQYSAGLVQTLANLPSSDVNTSGGVNPVDAALILQVEAGFIPLGSLHCS